MSEKEVAFLGSAFFQQNRAFWKLFKELPSHKRPLFRTFKSSNSSIRCIFYGSHSCSWEFNGGYRFFFIL